MKHEKVILASLLLFTPLTLLTLDQTHPQLDIGIVLVDETDDHYANEIIEGFEEHDGYFEARLLPERFNASQVKVQTGLFHIEFYLNSDLVEKALPLDLADRYDVDIILLFTDHAMADWDDTNESLWAQAFPEHSAVVISSFFFTGDHYQAAKQLALHETLHLLGYTHNFVDGHGIMGAFDYGAEEREPLPYARLQLPLRCHLFALVGATSFVNIVALSRLTFALLLLPPFAAAEILLHRRYRDREPGAEHHKTMVAAAMIGSFALLAIFVESYIILLMPLVVMVGVHEGYERYLEREAGSIKDEK